MTRECHTWPGVDTKLERQGWDLRLKVRDVVHDSTSHRRIHDAKKCRAGGSPEDNQDKYQMNSLYTPRHWSWDPLFFGNDVPWIVKSNKKVTYGNADCKEKSRLSLFLHPGACHYIRVEPMFVTKCNRQSTPPWQLNHVSIDDPVVYLM